jgi:hypothetical protein
MSTNEIANVDAADGLPAPSTAAEKIKNTLRELSKPDPGANGMELTLATVAMGLESGLDDELLEHQASGQLDEFVLSLTRFLALHRSDNAPQLMVVELPRHHHAGRPLADQLSDLPTGTRLRLLDEAVAAAAAASSPL